jgi:EAL domain-containing protein (putative c-di-GMP-specific phosphodiesterase class I)
MNLSECVHATLVADELGLASARLGDCLLSTRFAALHRFDGRTVAPAAIQARMVARCSGAAVGAVRFMAALPPAERLLVDCAARAAHIANVAACDPLPQAPVFLDVDPASIANAAIAANVVSTTIAFVECADLHPSRFVFNLRGRGWLSPDLAETLADMALGAGFNVALCGFEGSGEDALALRRIEPSFVAFAATWYGDAARTVPARGLLRSVVSAVRDEGAEPIIPGIDDASAFHEALGMGSALLSGRFLSPSVDAGGTFEALRRFTPASGSGDGKVIRLFG